VTLRQQRGGLRDDTVHLFLTFRLEIDRTNSIGAQRGDGHIFLKDDTNWQVDAPIVVNVCDNALGFHHANDGKFGSGHGDCLPDGAFCAE